MISIEMCVRLEEDNLDLYVRGSNGAGIVKTENLIEKECMNSLFIEMP